MPTPSCSDQQFIAVFKELQSAKKVADRLGVDPRNVADRRRRVEARYGIVLPTYDPRRPQYNTYQSKHNARINLDLQNGYIIVGSDAHIWPGKQTTAMRALIKFVAELKPKQVHMNGDVFDGATISRHPKIGFLEKAPTVKEEIRACQDALAEIEEVAKDAKKVWEFGNHCLRFESFLAAKVQEYEGLEHFHLKDWFKAWEPCWSCHVNADQLGHLVIKHRHKGGVYDVRNNLLAAHTHMVTGHTHALKWWPMTTYRAHTLYGVNTGTLAEPHGEQFVHYTEDAPTDWRSGFAVLQFWRGRLLMPELVEVIGDGLVNFRGEVLQV